MHVNFKIGQELDNGFKITSINGISRYIAENEKVIICFDSEAGTGRNYSKIQWYTDKETGKQYKAWRYTHKFVNQVQRFSNELFIIYLEFNK
jgi:hypothetical protein